MRKLLLGGFVLLAACSDDSTTTYAPTASGLPSEIYAGASLALTFEPALPSTATISLRFGDAYAEVVGMGGGLTVVVPPTLNGLREVVLQVDGEDVWRDSVDILGFTSAAEVNGVLGANHSNLLVVDYFLGTQVYGGLADGRLATIIPSVPVLQSYDTLLPLNGLRTPGPTLVTGEYVMAPAAATAVDSLEIWQLEGGPTKVRRIPRLGAQRQIAQLGEHQWLVTGSHGAWVVDDSANAVVFDGTHSYEEPQVLFRSPSGQRTTMSFHGGSATGTPVFGIGGGPVYHLGGLRGVNGVSFPPGGSDTGRMVLVGHDQALHGLLMEVKLQDGARVDSIPLDYEPRAVKADPAGNVYVLGADSAARPFIEVFARPGYPKIGHLQAPANALACGYWCEDAVLGMSIETGQLQVVEGMVPNGVGRTGNGVWTFRFDNDGPELAHTVRWH